MRILFLTRFTGPIRARFFDGIRRRLARRGIEIDVARGSPPRPARPASAYDLLVTLNDPPPDDYATLPHYGGRDVLRPDGLRWLSSAKISTMRWDTARSAADVGALFDRWEVERLILKRSRTGGGKGTTIFRRDSVDELEWDPEEDVFCAEVNPDDGDVYKIELFGPTVLVAWKSRAKPFRTMLKGESVSGPLGAYGRRSLIELPEPLVEAARRFGRAALERGHGHISLDFMKAPSGELMCIEANFRRVALWWTGQFPFFVDRFAHAVHELAIEHGAPPTAASLPPPPLAWRMRNALEVTLDDVRLLRHRIVQGILARFR